MNRAHIHHKEGNPLNNHLGNWEVLYSTCHRAFHRLQQREARRKGFSIAIVFRPVLRRKILSEASYQCTHCGTVVDDIGCNTQNRPQPCRWCHRLVNKKDSVTWQDGRIMCEDCFEEWLAGRSARRLGTNLLEGAIHGT
jgi:hypothetical protein